MSVVPVGAEGASPVRLELPARPEAIPVVRHALLGLADALGLHDETVADICVAVSEACTNVIVHAYADGGPLELEASTSGRTLVVVVRDHGPGITPRLQRESGGLGLGMALMAALSSRVCFTSPRPGTNEVWMTFRLDEARAADEIARP